MAEVNEVEEALSKLRESDFSTGETYEKARLEALRSAMESAKDAIKACLLINGGAAGGLLAFMGHLATVGNDLLIRGLLVSLLLFGGGLITAIIAHGTAYASHFNFARDFQHKKWRIYRGFAVGVTTVSILLFALGGYLAYRAFFQSAIQIKLKVSDALDLQESFEKK